MSGLIISRKVREKLKEKHEVAEEEVEQCFVNIDGKFLIDNRENHRSDPPTQWFIAETDYGKKLKVVFIKKDGDIILRTAYTPNKMEVSIYNKYAK